MTKHLSSGVAISLGAILVGYLLYRINDRIPRASAIGTETGAFARAVVPPAASSPSAIMGV